MIKKATLQTLILLFFLTNCRTTSPKISDVKIRPYDPNAENMALLFAANPDENINPEADVKELETILKETPEYGYKTIFTNLTAKKDEILTQLKDASEKIKENSTLLIYISSHGEVDSIYTQDSQNLYYKELVAALVSTNRTTPIKHLILIIDACHSGSWVDDFKKSPQVAEELNPMFMEKLGYALIEANHENILPVAESFLIFSASEGDESAGDRIFTPALIEAFKTFKADKSGTLRDLVDETIKKCEDQTPQYFAFPYSIMKTPLFTQDIMKCRFSEDDINNYLDCIMVEELPKAINTKIDAHLQNFKNNISILSADLERLKIEDRFHLSPVAIIVNAKVKNHSGVDVDISDIYQDFKNLLYSQIHESNNLKLQFLAKNGLVERLQAKRIFNNLDSISSNSPDNEIFNLIDTANLTTVILLNVDIDVPNSFIPGKTDLNNVVNISSKIYLRDHSNK